MEPPLRGVQAELGTWEAPDCLSFTTSVTLGLSYTHLPGSLRSFLAGWLGQPSFFEPQFPHL